RCGPTPKLDRASGAARGAIGRGGLRSPRSAGGRTAAGQGAGHVPAAPGRSPRLPSIAQFVALVRRTRQRHRLRSRSGGHDRRVRDRHRHRHRHRHTRQFASRKSAVRSRSADTQDQRKETEMKLSVRMLALACSACAAFAAVVPAQAGTLNVTVSARGNQRATWQNAFDEFKKANPDVDLKVSYVGEEANKVQMSGWLATDPPDVLSWHNGERMAYFAKRGLLADLTSDWQKNGW